MKLQNLSRLFLWNVKQLGNLLLQLGGCWKHYQINKRPLNLTIMKPQYNLFLNNYRMIIKNGPVKNVWTVNCIHYLTRRCLGFERSSYYQPPLLQARLCSSRYIHGQASHPCWAFFCYFVTPTAISSLGGIQWWERAVTKNVHGKSRILQLASLISLQQTCLVTPDTTVQILLSVHPQSSQTSFNSMLSSHQLTKRGITWKAGITLPSSIVNEIVSSGATLTKVATVQLSATNRSTSPCPLHYKQRSSMRRIT